MIERCRLCGSDKLSLWMTEGRNLDLNYYRCGVCALWNYDLDCGLDQTQYTETYVSPIDETHKSNQEVRQCWEFLKGQLPEPGSMMDIGCGNGALMYFAREAGWRVRGMELAASTAKNIWDDQQIEVEVANFLEYQPKEGEQYDLVVLRHVLEHLPDSILAMNRIGSLLKPAGFALLEFPNTRSFAYAYKRFLKNRGLKNRKYSSDWRPGHCNEFCRRSFELLLEKTGFEMIVWRTYSHKPISNALYRVLPVASKVRTLVRKRATH